MSLGFLSLHPILNVLIAIQKGWKHVLCIFLKKETSWRNVAIQVIQLYRAFFFFQELQQLAD